MIFDFIYANRGENVHSIVGKLLARLESSLGFSGDESEK
jgi:hypothetical protein